MCVCVSSLSRPSIRAMADRFEQVGEERVPCVFITSEDGEVLSHVFTSWL